MDKFLIICLFMLVILSSCCKCCPPEDPLIITLPPETRIIPMPESFFHSPELPALPDKGPEGVI